MAPLQVHSVLKLISKHVLLSDTASGNVNKYTYLVNKINVVLILKGFKK